MAKVFRIFRKSLKESEAHWFNSDAIDHGIIDSIEVQETEGKKQPTSIPSPFAQIDLIRSAFTTVNHEFTQNGVDLDSKKDAHRLVSNALDIGQIFFNFDKFKKYLSIEFWDKNTEIQALIDSNTDQHRHLGRTLKMFLEGADSENFNFDKLDKIFILKYNNQVIGGTSPKTLFFASSDATKVGVNIDCGNDKMLDDKPLALYKRDKDYVRFLYLLSSNPSFSTDFPEVSEYLDLTRNKVLNKTDLNFSNELRGQISPSDFIELSLPNNSGIPIEVFRGYQLYQSKPVTIDSEFFINSSKQIEKPPMVLPVEKFNRKLIYTTEEWEPSTEVPHFDSLPLDQRTLPRVNDKYPYLTLSDFLEDSIIKLPYKLDSSRYLAVHQNENYLLPLKPLVFDYFTAEEIINNQMITLVQRAGEAIEVKLKIPIKKSNEITYTKIYNKNSSISENENSKYGSILEANFSLGIYPFVSSKKEQINFTVATADTNSTSHLDSVVLMNSIKSSIVKSNNRIRSKNEGLRSSHYLTNNYFDVIQIQSFGKRNIIIPKFKKHDSTSDVFEFAIDFGTTNTHIEYIHSTGKLPTTYELETDHFVFLRDKNTDLRGKALTSSEDCEATLTQELIHNSLGKKQYSFPFRSVILENKTINYNNPNYLYGDVNIGFDYEKISIREHLTRRSNLKWLHLDSDNNNKRIEKFIEQLLELCKNKVLFTNGDLAKTKITWLYPTSMSYQQRTRFEVIWEEKFKDIFEQSDTDNIRSIPESIAPFYYYKERKGLMNQSAPTVSIDIGGGTSDITIFTKNQPQVISSFRFAGNSIFGDGFNSNIHANGFVSRYYPKYKSILEGTADNIDTSNELRILNEIFSNYQSSDDLSNFLFSLEENYNLNKQDIKLNYSKDLTDDPDLKVVFLIFFASIIYHVAQIMKRKNMELPENILFSGTASKTINILDHKHKKLTELFNEIFNYVFKDNKANVSIRIDDSPKVLTSKGALMVSAEEIDLNKAMYSFIGDSSAEDRNITYNQLDNEIIKSVILNVDNFYNLMEKINSKMSFNDSFGVSHKSLEALKEIRNSNIKDFIVTAIDERKKDIGNDEMQVNETLFFYPFIGLLNRLATAVVS